MLLLIDNYDSFTYNLVHYLGELGAEVEVWRNDALTVEEAMAKNPAGILLSPGPEHPISQNFRPCRGRRRRARPDGRLPWSTIHRSGLWRNRHTVP